MELAKRAKNVKESSTLSITALAKELKAQGMDIVSFSAGEPDFDTPEHVKQAAVEALKDGFTKYTATPGIIELRKAICEKLAKDNNLHYDPSQIVVSAGAKQAIYNTFLTILEEGDEVIIPAPCWVSYVEIVTLCGGVPVLVHTSQEDGFSVSQAQLQSALTPKTKAILINSPCNPTGVVYDAKTIQMIAEFAVQNNLFVISDEIYEKLIFDDEIKHVSIASLGDEIFKRTVVINGFSKSYSMTGWRIGYTASSKEMATVMGSIQSHTTSNANSIAQKAALAALAGNQDCVSQMRNAFIPRRDYIYERICNLPGISAVKPTGAFYVFANMEKLCGLEINGKIINNSTDLAEVLLVECHVALVPGLDFGYPNHMRISYSASLEAITKGMDRIETFLKKHVKA